MFDNAGMGPNKIQEYGHFLANQSVSRRAAGITVASMSSAHIQLKTKALPKEHKLKVHQPWDITKLIYLSYLSKTLS